MGPPRTPTYPLEEKTLTFPCCLLAFYPIRGYNALFESTSMIPGSLERGTMAENLDILNAAVLLVVKAALLAARFSGRVRRRSLKRLAAMDIDAKAKEITFLRDRVGQLRMQVGSQSGNRVESRRGAVV